MLSAADSLSVGPSGRESLGDSVEREVLCSAGKAARRSV